SVAGGAGSEPSSRVRPIKRKVTSSCSLGQLSTTIAAPPSAPARSAWVAQRTRALVVVNTSLTPLEAGDDGALIEGLEGDAAVALGDHVRHLRQLGRHARA